MIALRIYLNDDESVCCILSVHFSVIILVANLNYDRKLKFIFDLFLNRSPQLTSVNRINNLKYSVQPFRGLIYGMILLNQKIENVLSFFVKICVLI